MMRIKLVIFDFDGTLGDTRSTIVATMQQTIAELNLSEKSDEDCAATTESKNRPYF
jgi:phosphoglycolate phosphatase